MTTHLLVDTGRAARVTACDEPFANGEPGSEALADVTCAACAALFSGGRWWEVLTGEQLERYGGIIDSRVRLLGEYYDRAVEHVRASDEARTYVVGDVCSCNQTGTYTKGSGPDPARCPVHGDVKPTF